MRSYLLMGSALLLSTGLALAQSTGSTGTGTTSSPTTTSPSTTGTRPTTSPSQTTPQGSQTTTPQTTTPSSSSSTGDTSRTGSTGTGKPNPVPPPNSPSSVTPAVSPASPGSYNPNTAGSGAGSGKPNGTASGISGPSTAALDLKHGTKVSKLKDARSRLVGVKLVDTKGQAIGEVAEVRVLRGHATAVVVALNDGRKVAVSTGPMVYLADNNTLVTRQSAKSIERKKALK